MEFHFGTVDKDTYDRERAERLMPAALRIGSICTIRELTGRNTVDYAIDVHVRIAEMGEPNDAGKKFIEAVVLDADLRDLKYQGRPLHVQTLLGRDGIIYEPGGTEDGYFPGATDPWDISKLENLATPDVVGVGTSRQLVTV